MGGAENGTEEGVSRCLSHHRRRSLSCLLVVILVTYALVVCTFYASLTRKPFQTDRPLKDDRQRRKIIILSYMRSGSTLTGDIIQQHPGVFYMFEPLYTTVKLIKSFIPFIYMDKQSGLIHSEHSQKMNVLTSMFNCSLDNLDILTLHQHHMTKSKSTEKFRECMLNSTVRSFKSDCLVPLIKACQDTTISLTKTIRVKMEEVEELLHLHRDLKVVHLLRDPRAVLLSRAKLARPSSPDMNILDYQVKQSASHCASSLRDVRDAYRLSKLYPGRVAILLYEKLVQNPTAMTKVLYNYLDLDPSPHILEYVHNITAAGHPDDCPVCTTRRNSTKTANRWRFDLDIEHIVDIDRNCFYLYKELGYVHFDNNLDLKNLNVPSWVEKPVKSMLTDKKSSG